MDVHGEVVDVSHYLFQMILGEEDEGTRIT